MTKNHSFNGAWWPFRYTSHLEGNTASPTIIRNDREEDWAERFELFKTANKPFEIDPDKRSWMYDGDGRKIPKPTP